MPLLTVANLQHAYGSDIVLDGTTFAVEPGEKCGLVGRNGSGKTTLMKILLGELAQDAGHVQLQKGARVGYLSQDPKFDPNDTVRDAAERAFAELHDLHVEINKVYEDMATAEGDALDRLLKQQATLDAKIEAAGGYAIDHRIDATLHGLGFTDAQFTQPVRELSGGQKNRLGLARLLLEAPDLLMLDEPTNHLDIAGREWLEEFLSQEYPGAVLLVSHDRWLLDRVVDRILEVERGQVRSYPGNYEKYSTLRRERQMTEARVHDKQLDRIRQEEQFIRRYKAGQRAKQARGRQSRLDRFKRDQLVERPMELDVMKLTLPKAPQSGDMVLGAEDISKSFGDLTLFEDFSIRVSRGDRIGIIGPNGVGKTTLVRCLLPRGDESSQFGNNIEPDAGEVRIGSRVSIGYYRQLHEHLDMSLTVWQYLQKVIVSLDGQAKASEQQARDLAGAFLFSGDDQDKTLGMLSGGERSRAVLAGLVAGAHNLLVLDEPTNHLDIPSAERLEQALTGPKGFDGTLLVISHDRSLLQATCERLIIFDGRGGVRVFEGTYRDWLAFEQRQRDERAQAKESSNNKTRKSNQPVQRPSAASSSDNGNPLAKVSMSNIEAQIEAIETEIGEIDAAMVQPDVYTDGEKSRQLQNRRSELAQQLQPLEAEWTRRAEASADG